MIKKTQIVVLSFLCAALAGCGSSRPSAEKETSSFTIVTATDLHYLSPELTDYGTGFMRMAANGDGKLVQYAPEIVDAFVTDMEKLRPDAVILSGDLSFNGEKASHEELAEKLSCLQEQGIPVLVLPGNHDISYPFAASFEAETVTRTERVNGVEFRDLYKQLGYRNAAETDGDSLSFLYQLSERVWILLLDANTEDAPGRIKDSTLQWAERQMERAEEAGAAVITVTHQNVLAQNKLLSRGFLLDNHEELERLLKGHGVVLNVSGHVHIQHIAENGGLYDIATGSLTVAPNRYGVLTVGSDGSTSYETRKVHVGRWDREKAGIAGDFENFEELSQAYFDECTRKKMKKELEALSVSEEERGQMTELAVEMNRNYFAGMTKPEKEIADTPGWKLWKEKGAELFFGSYMDSMMEDAGHDENRLLLPPKSDAGNR